MTGALQGFYQNFRSFAVAAAGPPVIGQAFGGGFYAGQISTSGNSVADYYLITGPVSTAQSSLQFKTTATATADTSSVIAGPTNSTNMNNASHPAAQFCEGLTIGGFSDWYMPAKNELEVCYYNLKPTTQSNSTTLGINVNAVPARASNYTAGNPAQTSAAAFVTSTGAEAFSGATYWSSTQSETFTNRGIYINFNSGDATGINKTYSYRVRAVRRVAI